MKKYNNFILLLTMLFMSNVFGVITKCISATITHNYNSTGKIIYEDYESNLNIEHDTIKVYNYFDNVEKNTDLQNLEPNLISVLIPKKTEYTNKTSCNVYDDILFRMCSFVNSQNTNLAFYPITEPFLNTIDSYLVANNLENSFNLQKKAKLADAIIGSHALFMPQNKSQIKAFNGISRVLTTFITNIDDLLLTKNDFDTSKTIITEEQIAILQQLIFQETQKARTVIFIPECISRKNFSNQTCSDIRLPIAIINKIDLIPEDNTICIQLLANKIAKNDFSGCWDFLHARHLLFQNKLNINNQWEFIHYTFKIGPNNTSNSKDSSIYHYKVSNINIEQNGSVNIQQNYNATTINNTHDTEDQQEHDTAFNDGRSNNDKAVDNSLALFSIAKPINHHVNACNLLHNKECDQENSRLLAKDTVPPNEKLQHIAITRRIQNDDSFKNLSPCEHYKRKCLVKIQGDNKYIACHRCYNIEKGIQDNFKIRKKSWDVIALKCLVCRNEQIFAEDTGSHCLQCGVKFSEYYCQYCKHLTGLDYSPYHCNKCGICRKNGNRSFHCDACEMCLDEKLRGNHKCRSGGAHDECCICLQDSFAGCYVLPCSHKIHTKCLQQMIDRGIRRCPICRACFQYRKNGTKKQPDNNFCRGRCCYFSS